MNPLSAYLLAVLVLASPAAAKVFEFDFADHRPAWMDDAGRNLHVDAGVLPGTDLVFEVAPPGDITLRPAGPDEHTDTQRTVYRFEWSDEHKALFYAVPDPAHVAELVARNAADTASETGSAYEQEAARGLFAEGAMGPRCLKTAKVADGPFRLFLTIDADGKATESFAQPVGHVATCLADRAREFAFARPASTPGTAPEAGAAFVAIVQVIVKP